MDSVKADVPFYIARKSLESEVKSFSLSNQGRVLDVGSGSQRYRKFFNDYTSLEREGVRADYNYKPNPRIGSKFFPFKDKEFDTVICTQVLEHVFEPDSFLKEIKRVCKGKILITCPLMWGEHEQPLDYARYSSFGLKSLLIKNGYKIIYQKKTCADASALFQMISLFIYYLTFEKKWTRILGKMITLPITGMGLCLGWLKTKEFYLDNIVVCE